jgi:tetratricopeptide (TPR) repeat protein
LSRSDFASATEEFKRTDNPLANKFLAICYYNQGYYTDALKILDEEKNPDDESLYYYGLTCEKLNLFDKALDSYKKIKSDKFFGRARQRLGVIEKQAKPVHIKEINADVNRIISSAPSAENYPQAGAQILFCDEKIEITPDNKEISYLHYVVRILNERGKESFSEAHIEYDSTYEKIELEYARTIKPDGVVVDVGSRHIRDVTKYLNFPLYSNARVYIISFPEIAEGANIEYKLKVIRNQLINKKDFIMGYPVQSSEPIITANFTIELPQEKTLHIKTLNEKYNNFAADLKPRVEQKADKIIYRWQFRNIPQIIPESNMPPMVEINPTLLVSTFDRWDDMYSWWWGLARDKMTADDAIKEKTGELTRGDISDEAKVRKIYNFCAKEIRYVAVEYGQAGYEPHQAADIFRNKYGDCKDQAILLVTMLKKAHFSAWPVLIGTKDYYNLNEDFPSMLFNHAIAAVSLNDKIVFLDPTAETCSFGDLPAADQGRHVLVCREDGYKIENTPLYPAQHNLARQIMDIKINADESITAEKAIFSFGVYDQAQRYWLLYTVPELIREQIESKIQETSIGARLNSYNINNLEDLDKPVELNYRFQGPEYFTIGGKLRIMSQLASLDTSIVAKDKRRYPIDFDILDTKEAGFNILLPSNFVLKYMPLDLIEDNPWFKFTAEYKHQDNKLIFRQRIELKKNIVSENEYPDFKNFFESLAKKMKQRIVLERLR